jgi:hypothetical protein
MPRWPATKIFAWRRISTPAIAVLEADDIVLAEVIADHGIGTRLLRLGVRSGSEGRSGSPAHMHAKHGIDRPGIVKAARGLLAGISAR